MLVLLAIVCSRCVPSTSLEKCRAYNKDFVLSRVLNLRLHRRCAHPAIPSHPLPLHPAKPLRAGPPSLRAQEGFSVHTRATINTGIRSSITPSCTSRSRRTPSPVTDQIAATAATTTPSTTPPTMAAGLGTKRLGKELSKVRDPARAACSRCACCPSHMASRPGTDLDAPDLQQPAPRNHARLGRQPRGMVS